VGIQSVVKWDKRGVVTSANMFARYLGQSLGAAIFGAIFNAAMMAKFSSASGQVQKHIPSDLDKLVSALHNPQLGKEAANFLRHAIYIATHHIYIGMSVFAVATLLCVFLAPRKFPIVDDDSAPFQ